MGCDESFYFLAHGFVSPTSFRKKAGAFFGRPLKSGMEKPIQVLPVLGCHDECRILTVAVQYTSPKFHLLTAHGVRFIRRSRSMYRGSERRPSKRGSILSWTSDGS